MKRHLAAAGCIALLAALAGCSNPPSEVAEVAGTRISSDQVRSQVAAVENALGAEPGSVSMSAITQFLVGGEVAEEVAAQAGIALTAERKQQFAATAGAQLGGLNELWADPSTRELAENWVEPMILAEQLGTEQYLLAASQVPVTMNPAYGTWDPATHAVTPGGSLSVSFAELGQ